MWCDAFSNSCIHSVFLREERGKEREKSDALSQWANFWISNASLLQPTNPPTPHCWGSLISKGAQTHERTHKTAFPTPNTFLLANAHSHTCTPVSAHITVRPSINKHKSNEKQHNTLQLGHFKHVQEELRTLIQQPSRDRANSCLPYPTKVPCRQEKHSSVLPSLRIWKSNQAKQGLLHSAADVEEKSKEYRVEEKRERVSKVRLRWRVVNMKSGV